MASLVGEIPRDPDKSSWSAQRLLIDAMSGQQIVEYVKAGHTVGDVTFDTWLEQVGEDLKFGDNASTEMRSDIA